MNSKQKVMNKLKGSFEVTKVEKKIDDDVCILCDFTINEKKGRFRYILEGNERGIDEVIDFEEEEEDIYEEIHNWIEEHIYWTTIIKVDGKEIK